jgi:hypothetical protein
VPPQDPPLPSPLAGTEPVKPEVEAVAKAATGGPAAQVTATVDLVKAYARQETLDHFKGIGKWIGFGVVGATSLAIGIVLLIVGVLRLIQDVAKHSLYGVWSIVPYLIVLVVCGLVVALALSRVQATDVHRQGRKP